MAEETVVICKYRLFEFMAEVEDAMRPGQTVLVPRTAAHGQRISTAEYGSEPNTVYGLREPDLLRGERLGAFFTDLEMEAMSMGITDAAESVVAEAPPGEAPIGDTTPAPPPNPEAPHPLALAQMTATQLAEVIRERDVSVDDLIEAAADYPGMANVILEAESIATGGNPREGLAEGLAAATAPAGRESEIEPLAERPTRSASRAEWNNYAAAIGVDNPAGLPNVETVIAEVEKKEQS